MPRACRRDWYIEYLSLDCKWQKGICFLFRLNWLKIFITLNLIYLLFKYNVLCLWLRNTDRKYVHINQLNSGNGVLFRANYYRLPMTKWVPYRPLKKVLFDTTGFLEAQNLTQEQRDSRQNLYDNRSKEQCFKAICEHITAVQWKECEKI